MIKLINTNKRLAFVESNSKGIVVERENTFFRKSTLFEGNSNYPNDYAKLCRENYV